MNFLKPTIILLVLFISCKSEVENISDSQLHVETEEISAANKIAQLKKDGFEIFEYVDAATGDTIVMQQYFMSFLKRGKNRSQSKTEADSLQTLHLAHLSSMYEKGFADISGPFGDDGEIRGITIYNVPTMKMADSLANLDPMVKAGKLEIEIKPWWAGKGFSLR
ncbi:MAG: YciI family protein [Patiriisocius sp.]|uniref:YciI family protein n=1 Tax=Patiriisocius sp. TaxID=2822396 RepID=UPI003EF64FEE